MKKTLLIILSVAGMATATYAQTEPDVKEKTLTHHVGIQINELIRQVFNFSNSTSTVNNPYLLTYSLNSARSGWGGRLGLGYTYQSFTDEDGISRKETHINQLNLRIGAEKAFVLSGKWTAGVGVDGIYNLNDDKTRSLLRSFDTTTTVTTSKISSYGGDVMGWVRYKVSERLVIGTEVSFYYTTGNQKQEISITRKDFNVPGSPYTTTISKVDNNLSEARFRLPVAIFLMVKI